MPITSIWALFFLVFSLLGYYHFRARSKSISHLKVSESDIDLDSIVTYGGPPNLEAWVDKFNAHIDYMNETSRHEHLLQAIGYSAATMTSIFSLFLFEI